MRLFIVSICFVLAFSTANSQEEKKITHEDLWLLKRVGTPKLSPDGKWVVFNLTEPAYDEKENCYTRKLTAHGPLLYIK